MPAVARTAAPTLGLFDNLGKGNIFEAETPLTEPKAFLARWRRWTAVELTMLTAYLIRPLTRSALPVAIAHRCRWTSIQ